VGIQHTIKMRNVLLLRNNVLDARKLVITTICVSRQSKRNSLERDDSSSNEPDID
jgi:hypothetical protein